KTIRKKVTVIVLLCMAVLLAACGKKDEARTIKAEKVNGTVTATTEKKAVDVKKGEKLKSGQTISVESDSDLTLLLDADKHVYAEENSSFNLVAKGSSGKTKTKIEVTSGKLTFSIDKKLKDKETFEVGTPNAVMSVRGTVFIVEIVGEGEDATTKIFVESGSIEVITEENGVERKETISAGQSMSFAGVAPGYESSKKTESNEPSKKRTENGPQVLSITYDSNGQEIKEYFDFFESYAEFTDKNLKPWILDLQGHDVVLEEILTFDTEVTIQNGTFVTSQGAYIVNKGIIHFGDDYNGNDWTIVESSYIGIENEGTILFRAGRFTVNDGVGIHNKGTIHPEYTDETKERFGSFEKTVTVNSGTFLKNDGKCLLFDTTITGSSEGLIVNNKELYLESETFYGNAPGYIVNNDAGLLWASAVIMYLEDDSAVGLKNFGSLEMYDTLHGYEGVYYSPYDPLILKITKGTGIINKGNIQGHVDCYMADGVGVDNFGTMYIKENSYGDFKGMVEGGLLLHNEKGARIDRLNANITEGQIILNEGTAGNGDEDAYSYYEITVVSDSYSGTIITNEKEGIMAGYYQITCTGLDNAKVLDNKGTVDAKSFWIASGFKLSELNDRNDWHDSSKDWLLHNGIDVRPSYEVDPAVSVNNTILINDEGNFKAEHVSGFILGTGSGTYEFYRPSGIDNHILGTVSLVMYSSNATGISIDSGVTVELNGCECYIGKAEEGARDVPMQEWGYYSTDKEFDRSICSGNTGINNKGKLITIDGGITTILRGSQNRGLHNEGFIELSGAVGTNVYGDRNIGTDNLGSINGGHLSASIMETGGNIGARNFGTIRGMGLDINNNSNYSIAALYRSSESPYGKDIGFYNTSTGIVDSPEEHLDVNNWSKATTGLINEKQITVGDAYFSSIDGIAVYLAEESLTQTTNLDCDNWIQVNGIPNDLKSECIIGGTVLSISGQMEVFPGTADYDSYGAESKGSIEVMVTGSGATGIYIAPGGSLYQVYSHDHGGAILKPREGAVAIINEGHLHLDYPIFFKEKGSEYTKCLTDRGTFSFTQDPIIMRDGYGRYGCPGPWYGIDYNEYSY
nr:FecR family protein [Lachnospiraceae bacterium]